MVLTTSTFFQGLTEAQVDKLALNLSEAEMTRGQWLFHEGQDGDELYLLIEGAVEFILEVDDTFLPISILRTRGDCFGTSALIHPYQYSISARCLEEGRLLVIKREQLQRLIDENREFGRTLMTNLAKSLLATLNETRRELIIHFRNMFKATQ
jgi:CRP/FNR family transcriptional regulator, cyclic AMP receptor protein